MKDLILIRLGEGGGHLNVGWKIIKKRIPLPSADFAITGIEI